ncbi:hypothetical protein BJ742DRAFT_86273 [Cladochytrium replicatum]|nr:hypothetical protein BJ742DRAFT_86273 [Cladochytrium replicatum]
MYPLSWQHILIPVLPAKLLSYLQAPMPYIVGVRRDYFTVERANEWKPTDACVVDLDSDTLEMNEVGPVPMLPARDRRKLVTRIAKYAQCASWTQIVSAGLAPGSTINPNGGPVVRYKMRGPPISTIFALPGGKRVLAPSTATSAVAVRSNGTEKHTGKAKSFGDSLNKVKHGWAENTGPAGFLRLGTGKVVNIGESGGGGLFVSIQSLASSTTSSGPGGVVVNEEEEQTAGGGGLSSSQSPFSVSKWIGQQQQRARRQRGDGGEGEPSNSPGKTENEMEESTIVGDRSEAGSVGSSPFSVQFKKMFSRSSANESATLSISTNATGSTSLQNSPSASSFASIFTNLTSPAALNRGPKDSSFTPTTRQRQRSSQLPTSSTIPEEHGHKKSNRASMKISFQRGPLVSFQTQNTLWKQQSTTGSWSTSSETEGGIGTGTATTKAENSGSIEFGVPNVYSREGHILHECVGDTMTLAREVDIDGVAGLGHGKEGEGRQIMTQDGSSWALSPSTAGTQLAPLGSRECEGCRVGSTCSLCQEDHSDHEKHWRCSTCHLVIHASCIPLLDARPCPGSFDESKIRRAFLKVFTSLLKCYRQYLVIPDAIQQLRELENRGGLRPDVLKSSGGAPNVSDLVQDDWFKRQEYLNSLDKEGAFMTHVVETQSFAQFTLDRIERPESDYDVLFFDESIKAKLNRSRLKITKDSTPFLKDGSFRVQQTFYVLPPNTDDLTGEEVSSQRGTVPLELDERLLCPPRVVQSLITETDSHIMRSHTFELVQKARMSSMKRKQDVSKWMRSKWKHFQKIGNGQIVGIGFLSDEQRREMFEQRLAQVSDVIDGYEATHLSSQPAEEVLDALRHLQEQHLVLLHAVDEEQLVESSEQEDLQKMYMRLFRVITIYQDHLMSLGYDASAIAEVMNAVSANVSNRTSMLEIFKDGHPASSRASSLSRDASGSIKASARSTQSSIRVTIHGRTASSLAALYEVHTEEIDSPSDHVPLYLLRQQARSTTKLQNGVTESADVPSDTHQDNQQLRMHSASTSPDDSPRASTTQVKQRKASTTSPHEPTPPKSPPPQHLGRPTRPLPVVPRKSFTMPGQEEIKENREHQASRDAFAAQ